MWKELAGDYGLGLALGGVGEVAGAAFQGVANGYAQTATKAGHAAAKELAKNGGKFTPFARQLIKQGKSAATCRRILNVLGGNLDKIGISSSDKLRKYLESKEVIDSFCKEMIERLKNTADTAEFLLELEIILEQKQVLIEALIAEEENIVIAKKEIFNAFRQNLLKLNERNVKVYLDNQENKSCHKTINEQINRLLKIIKEYQLKLHHAKHCCSACRFC
jgi:hypothetical protein